MADDDFIDIHTSNDLSGDMVNNELHNDAVELSGTDSQASCCKVKGDALKKGNLGQCFDKIKHVDEKHTGTSFERDTVDEPTILQGTVANAEKMNYSDSAMHDDNDFQTNMKESIISCMRDGTTISGVKRARLTNDDQQPLVHVMYNSLSRQSKKKLEELLHQWSEWHAQQCSSSKDSDEPLESGEETFYPALHVGPDKSSTVSFSVDNQVGKKQRKDFMSLNNESVPLYNREYAMVLTSVDGTTNLDGSLEKLDASRCFNCDSYNHSLKDCPKPRDNVTVNNARKQHQSKKIYASGPRIPTRYYQSSPGGKYDGLKPGVLGAETRKLLGLRELDPPPWLNRMREIGYPPGYLDPKEEDQPSGITIYADEGSNGEHEENLKSDNRKPLKNMTVDFPGINALIPENADQQKWAPISGTPSFDSSRDRSNYMPKSFSEYINTGHPHEQMWPGRFSGDSLGASSSISGYLPNYVGFDPNYKNSPLSSRSNISANSPSIGSFGRSFTEIGRWNHLVHKGSPHYSPRSFLPYSSSYPW